MQWGGFLLLLTLPAPWEPRLPLLGWAQVLAASCGSGRGEAGVRGAPACRRVSPAPGPSPAQPGVVGAVQWDVGGGGHGAGGGGTVPEGGHAVLGASHPVPCAACVPEPASSACRSLAAQPVRLSGSEVVKTNTSLLALEAGRC